LYSFIVVLCMIRTGLCSFSGYKIYPGHGIRIIRSDGKTFTFIDSKTKLLFRHRKNPRKTKWTQVYRRLNKKGVTEEVVKRKARKVQKVERAVVGASLELIRQKRAQKPEVRAAAREAALNELKERKKKQASNKKDAAKAAPPAAGAKKEGAKKDTAKGAAVKKPAQAKPAAQQKQQQPKMQKSAGKGSSGGKGR